MNSSSDRKSQSRKYDVQCAPNIDMLKIETLRMESTMSVKRKVRYLVEIDQVEGKATILMTADDLRSQLEDILKAENIRCVNYFADGVPMQKYLDKGVELRNKLDQIFG